MSKKKSTIKKNKKDGARKEKQTKFMLELQGKKVTRKPHGQDFISTDHDPVTGKQIGKNEHVEVKKGKSKLSKLQKKTKKEVEKKGGKYSVKRFDNDLDNEY